MTKVTQLPTQTNPHAFLEQLNFDDLRAFVILTVTKDDKYGCGWFNCTHGEAALLLRVLGHELDSEIMMPEEDSPAEG